jgi:hypothetical protein
VPGQPAGRSLPLAGGLTFGAFPIVEYTRAGKTVREDTGETALFTFQVNELEPWMIGGQRPTEWEAVETDAFMQLMAVSRSPQHHPTIRKPAVAKWLSNAKATRIRR